MCSIGLLIIGGALGYITACFMFATGRIEEVNQAYQDGYEQCRTDYKKCIEDDLK